MSVTPVTPDSAVTPVTPLPGSRADKVDAVAQAVRSVAGVADLHGGVLGEIGTYLPGRRVLGVRLRPETTEVHVSLLYGAPVRETAAAVRDAVVAVVPGPVDVTVEDVVTADQVTGPDDAGSTGEVDEATGATGPTAVLPPGPRSGPSTSPS